LIVFRDAGAPIGTLSGGNQQKVLLARWLACEPRLLLMNDPTRGVDLGTRLRLYAAFKTLARDGGIPIVVLSSEIEEILQLCDRVLVFREQALARELRRDELAMDRVIAAMFGQESPA
jgi:galactofuranose transport system ATP-binding protein